MEDFKLVFLSKGVLANIFATDCAESVFRALPYQCAIPDYLMTSRPVLWDISSESETMIDCRLIMADLVSKQLLHPFPLQKEHYFHQYLLLGKFLREELADLFTLASVQQAAVAVDDPVIKKRVAPLLPGMILPGTLTLLHQWFTIKHFSAQEFRRIVHHMVLRSQFQPSKQDSLYSWWNQFSAPTEPPNNHVTKKGGEK